MRKTKWITAVICLGLLLVFILVNNADVKVSFLIATVTAPVSVMMILSGLLGAIGGGALVMVVSKKSKSGK